MAHELGPEIEEESYFNYFLSSADEFFVENIPVDSIKELPPPFKYSFGFLSLAATGMIFIYFTITGLFQ